MIISEKQKFLDWLEEIQYLLPPKMTLSEARLIYERKIKEENELNVAIKNLADKVKDE